MMSLSLVKMVLGYLVHATATAGVKPQLLLTFGSKGDADGQFNGRIYGVACSPDGQLWAASGSQVYIFSDDGKFLRLAARGIPSNPFGIATDAEELAYICDYYSHLVLVCRPDGSLLRRIGSAAGDGPLDKPVYAAVDRKQNLLFVSQQGEHRVSVLKLDGAVIRSFGREGRGDGEFHDPRGVAVNAAGTEVAICDSLAHRIQVFDYNGKFLRKFGSKGDDPYHFSPGQMDYPFSIAADSANNWLVCALNSNRIDVFSSQGKFITAFANQRCNSVCVDQDDRIYVGLEHEVQVFGFEA